MTQKGEKDHNARSGDPYVEGRNESEYVSVLNWEIGDINQSPQMRGSSGRGEEIEDLFFVSTVHRRFISKFMGPGPLIQIIIKLSKRCFPRVWGGHVSRFFPKLVRGFPLLAQVRYNL